MKILRSNTGIVFSNTIRGISSSILNAFVCFAFTSLHSQTDLKNFIIFFTASNIMLIVLNWGLKDYSVKLFAAEDNPKIIFSKLFSLRTFLFLVLCVIVFFIPLEFNLLIFIITFSFFKFINNTIESFSILNNKNFAFALVDLISLVFLVATYILNLNFTAPFVFVLIIVSEILKAIIGLGLFYHQIAFQFINPLIFLKQTGNYFLVAFFSFLLSKADFYISSIYLPSKALINYHIFSSLIGLSQVIITAFFSRQMVNWFKSKEESFSVNRMRFFIASFTLAALALPCFYFITLYVYKFNISIIMLLLVFFNLLIYSFLLLEIYLKTFQNKHRVILSGVLLSSMINILLSFIFIRYYATLGAIFANIISLFILYLYFKIIKNNADPKTDML